MTSSKRTLLALPLALAAALVPTTAAFADEPSPAAEHFVTYSADINATVKNGFATAYSDMFESESRNADWSAKVTSHIEQLTFRKLDNQVMLLGNGRADTTTQTAGTIKSTYQLNLESTKTQTCGAKGSDDWGVSTISSAQLTPVNGDESLDFQLASDPVVSWNCTQPELGAASQIAYDDSNVRPYDFNFSMPREAVGYGEIIQLTKGPSGSASGYCLNGDLGHLKQCTFSWSGKIVMRKTGETTITTELPADTAPAGGGNAPANPGTNPAGPTSPSGVDTSGRPTASQPKVDPRTGDVVFSVTCPKGCQGSAILQLPGVHVKASAAAAAKPFAALRFAVKAGPKRSVRLRFPAKARKAMRKAGRARVKVTLTPKGGKATTRTFAVKVKKH